MEVRSFEQVAALQEALAEEMTAAFARSEERPHGVMLSGGSTPLALYRELAQRGVRAGRSLHVLYSDDRLVPSSSPDSNYGNSLPLVRALRLPSEHVMMVPGELELAQASEAYGQRLAAFEASGGTYAVGLLGIGTDGHTASLFSCPDAAIDDRPTIPVVRSDFERVSVTRRVLRQFERLILLATGEAKREMLGNLLAGSQEIPSGVALAGLPVEVWTDLTL